MRIRAKVPTTINKLNSYWSMFVKRGTDTYSEGVRNRGWYYRMKKAKRKK